jgi:6-pyruvoyltetrahydropterin/6-carboxytetrahydropterin synthase
MYYLKKTMEIAGAHKLDLDYESKCRNIHGHNWKITIYCKSETLNKNGMIIDFSEIKRIVNSLDHQNLNEILPFNTTAENIAEYLCGAIPYCYKVDVQESENNIATYEVD